MPSASTGLKRYEFFLSSVVLSSIIRRQECKAYLLCTAQQNACCALTRWHAHATVDSVKSVLARWTCFATARGDAACLLARLPTRHWPCSRPDAAAVVHFFRAPAQACRAAGNDCGETYRRIVASIDPSASLIKGPFNDRERSRAGLQRSWYTIDQWPRGARELLEDVSARHPAGSAFAASAAAHEQTHADLALLRSRIQHFCDSEAGMEVAEASAA